MTVTDRGDEESLPAHRAGRDVNETGITAVATDTDTRLDLDRPVRDHRELRDEHMMMTTGTVVTEIVVTEIVVTGIVVKGTVVKGIGIETVHLRLTLEIDSESLKIDRHHHCGKLQTIILQTKIRIL